eukprot:jgi/Chlat1/1453/Chrsp12S00105
MATSAAGVAVATAARVRVGGGHGGAVHVNGRAGQLPVQPARFGMHKRLQVTVRQRACQRLSCLVVRAQQQAAVQQDAVAEAGPSAGVSASSSGDDIPAAVRNLRNAFNSGLTRPLSWREQQLRQLLRMLEEKRPQFAEALQKDLGKGEVESSLFELGLARNAVQDLLDNFWKWAAPEKVATPLSFFPGSAEIVQEPLGVCLVIAPWNFPIVLLVEPLAAALAAGNAVVVKPSEVSSYVSAALAEYLPQYVDTNAVALFEGGKEVSQTLLKQRWDHIFFTGGGTVARSVLAAAAEHLTPVTLELGGKSPVFVDKTVNLEVAAKRIVSGKFGNAGQMCISPDYLLVLEGVAEDLLKALKATVVEFYGLDAQKSADFGRIVSQHHFGRLKGMLDEVQDCVVHGGNTDAASKFIAPTLLLDLPEDVAYWQDEVFGPLLAIKRVQNVDQAIEFINTGPKPLALYVFSTDEAVHDAFVQRTSSGGVCINDTVLHFSIPGLPFGGVGESGMGAYHGKRSFMTFSHSKGVAKRSFALPDPPIRYPPYTGQKLQLLQLLTGGSLPDWFKLPWQKKQ